MRGHFYLRETGQQTDRERERERERVKEREHAMREHAIHPERTPQEPWTPSKSRETELQGPTHALVAQPTLQLPQSRASAELQLQQSRASETIFWTIDASDHPLEAQMGGVGGQMQRGGVFPPVGHLVGGSAGWGGEGMRERDGQGVEVLMELMDVEMGSSTDLSEVHMCRVSEVCVHMCLRCVSTCV